MAKKKKRRKRGAKRKVKATTINVQNNYGQITINTGNGEVRVHPFAGGRNDPTELDRSDDHFSANGGGGLTESNPPGPDTLAKDSMYNNACVASTKVHGLWVSIPQIHLHRSGYIVLNEAAIRAYNVQPSMAIAVCVTPKEDALRLYVSPEKFPSDNSVNKYGFFKLSMKSQIAHVARKDPRTGEVWKNPPWLIGLLGEGSNDMQRLFKQYPRWLNSTANLFADKRFPVYKKGRRVRGSSHVLYCRTEQIVRIPRSLGGKLTTTFGDRVNGRLEWQASKN